MAESDIDLDALERLLPVITAGSNNSSYGDAVVELRRQAPALLALARRTQAAEAKVEEIEGKLRVASYLNETQAQLEAAESRLRALEAAGDVMAQAYSFKDGDEVWHECWCSKPKFKVGDCLKYADGPSAWFRVTLIGTNHGGRGEHRYWGDHMLGGAHGAYERDIIEMRRSFPKRSATDGGK